MGEQVKKRWGLTDLKNSIRVNWFPVWEVKIPDPTKLDVIATDKDVECRYIEVTGKTKDGKDVEWKFNFLDIFMFIYFIANEELRQQLNLRYERKVSYIPYEVSFRLTPEEKNSGIVSRRIELTVDELTMAIARNEALKIKDPLKYFKKK